MLYTVVPREVKCVSRCSISNYCEENSKNNTYYLYCIPEITYNCGLLAPKTIKNTSCLKQAILRQPFSFLRSAKASSCCKVYSLCSLSVDSASYWALASSYLMSVTNSTFQNNLCLIGLSLPLVSRVIFYPSSYALAFPHCPFWFFLICPI